MDIDLLEEAKKRPFAEKLQLVEDLWDAIAEEAAQRPLSGESPLALRRRARSFLNRGTRKGTP